MAQSFLSIGKPRLEHSNQNLSNDYKYSCKFGSLIPVCLRECIPGDVVKYGVESIVRLQPTAAPLLHRMDIRFEAFFVPNRLLWDKWKDFITGGEDGINTDLPPLWNTYFTNNTVKHAIRGKLWDYFSLPLPSGDEDSFFDKDVYALLSDEEKRAITPIDFPKRAYNLVWNEYYRDQNIQNEVDISSNEKILSRAFSKNDYFTSSLPFVQRGVSPTLSSFFDDTPVGFSDTINYGLVATDTSYLKNVSAAGYQTALFTNNASVGKGYVFAQSSDYTGADYSVDNLRGKNLEVRGTYDSEYESDQLLPIVAKTKGLGFSLDAANIRMLMQTQKFLERNARAGARYNEQVLAHFGVYTGDYRLQRPEFLGSTKSPIIVSEIPQTSETTDNSPQGKLTGKGLGAVQSEFVRYRCPEHGYFIVLASIVPKLSYNSQGVHKSWIKKSKLSYFFPEFSHLSEQPIHNSEIYFDKDFDFKNDDDSEVFGYTGIYNEYRDIPDSVAGQMRDTFDYWTLNRKFASMPALNSDFIDIAKNNENFARVFLVQDEDYFLVDVFNKCYFYRPIPALAEPGLVDHF